MVHFQVRRNKVRIGVALLLGGMVLQSGCGTLFYPERRGQTEGRIDPAIAILNGLGLLLFLIPGIIAFAVDFSTGAIYLPPGEESELGSTLHLNPNELTPERIAEVIREHTGVEVSLNDADLRVMSVEDEDAIEARLKKLQTR